MLNDPHSHGLWEQTAPRAPHTTELREDVAADVVIVGAGYTGLSTALHLCEQGMSVVVVEAIDIGFGGSGRNVGLVNAGLWVMPDVVTRRLGDVLGGRLLNLLADAPQLVFETIAKHSIECEARRDGTLHCAVGQRGYAELQQREAQWKARGAPVKLLSAKEAAARIGSCAYSGALFDARAGTIQPLAYARGLAQAAIAAGARVFARSPVVAAEQAGDSWIVRTASGSARGKWIVVATDAYSIGPWQLVRAEQLHLPYFNVATHPLDADTRASILPRGEGAWDTRQVLSSFRMDAAGRLVFGSIGALRGAARQVHEAWARRAIRKIFPQLSEVTFEARWFGHIGMTSDSLPRFHVFAARVIGFSGYNGRGIAPGTTFGRVLAHFIVGKLTQNDLPLPVSEPRMPALRPWKEAFYDLGSQAAHFTAARF